MRISDWSSDVCSSDLDKLDRRRVLTAVTFAAAVAAVLAGALADGPALGLYAMMFLLGGMSLPMYSLCIAHTNDYLTTKQMVAASGTLMLVVGTGAVVEIGTACVGKDCARCVDVGGRRTVKKKIKRQELQNT